jgi:uncharacterized RDD family membrane protein YckC
MNRAPFFVRGLAFLLDLFVLGIVWFVLFLSGLAGYLLGLKGAGFSSFLNEWDHFFSIFEFFSLFAFLFYFTYLTAYGARTAGKALFGIRVLKRDGDSPGFLRSFLRSALYPFSAFPFLLGFLMALVLKGRTFHDILAGTIVTREE